MLKSTRIDSSKEDLDVSPINDTKLTQRCSWWIKKNMDWHRYWNKKFFMVDSRGRYFPWTLRHNSRTWRGPKLCSGCSDLHRVTQRSERNSKDSLSAEVQRIMICAKWQNAMFNGDSKKCWMMFSRDCLACSFQFFPHPDRWVPLFYLTSSRRITHARYNSPSVSSSSFV